MTKRTLMVADSLHLPLDAATQTFAFIARKGGGKTYAAGKLVEELLSADVQVIILDTVGNWYGLRLGADGRSSGFDVPVLGGLRGDIPLEAGSGALIADIVVESGRSMVLDASQFSLADRKRFATAFGEQLWRRKKGETHPTPLHLVIEESQLIVPQNASGDVARMLGTYEEIIRLGRNYGIGVSMITQRPQSVNKEVLNQTECLFVGQINGSQERDALKKWITHQGMDVHLIDELPTLPVGTFYVWSPQWLRILEKIRIGKKRTLDSTATPKVGQSQTRRELKPLDLDDLKEKMSATIERAKADDPRELRKRIADLERAAKKAPALSEAATLDREVARITREANRAARAEWEPLLKERDATIRDLHGKLARISKAVDAIGAEIGKELPTLTSLPRPAATFERNDARRPAAPPSRVPSSAPQPEAVRRSRSEGVSGVEQRILNALAELDTLGASAPARELVAMLAGYTHLQSKGFVNAIGSLRTAGLVHYPDSGHVALTDDGRATADFPARPRSPEEVQSRICELLGGATAKVLRPLIDAYPAALPREAVAQAAGYGHLQSKGFVNALGRLRTLGFVDYPDRGTVVAQPVLFLESR